MASLGKILRCEASQLLRNNSARCVLSRLQAYSSSPDTEYAIEMACSNIRYGAGSTREVGMDCKNMGAKNVMVVTDSRLSKMKPVQTVIESLSSQGVPFKLYDKVAVEPTDESFKECIDFAKADNFDVFLAVGGGSVIDTCKAANLYSTKPDATLLDFVNAPIGKGLPITHQLKPLIAVPTTAGTGSETTGVAVFDYLPMKAKTGIANRALRPTLGIVDPEHLVTMPERVACYSGIDVLCHAIESYTAKFYLERSPRPTDPLLRPAYQGCNPISDIWSLHALKLTSKFIKRATFNADDFEARAAMHLASAYAGVGFGNAGCHLCHGMSYPISGNVKSYIEKGYNPDLPLIPHGLSVVVSAPAVFEFTAPACPDRHLGAAEALGVDISNARKEDAGKILSDCLRNILDELKVPNVLNAVCYSNDDVKTMVAGAMPQHRLIKLSPREVHEDNMSELFEKSMKIY
ncbi:hydroxyacid-oxoacid transhydrogenase, mitochondrial-like isoform X3 [Ruditapes philippinarum]|uniref:hydroxyacid-oxoacid transhydrogenase, mitochondrial-like isoform X3 n=1 Tax=Ruditapes philippinarum TaxID=129788 RepID=UPI00295B079A|nr:hydroxyacid-oxoacid transhydrogenase, mitochondrial-like isoform X3 [Ruditapes philippinarum]